MKHSGSGFVVSLIIGLVLVFVPIAQAQVGPDLDIRSALIVSSEEQSVARNYDGVYVWQSADGWTLEQEFFHAKCDAGIKEHAAFGSISLVTPPVPTLVSPGNDSVLSTLLPIFTVDVGVSNVEISSHLEWSRDPSFETVSGGIIYCGWTPTNTRLAYTPNQNLTSGAKYYWRARSAFGDYCKPGDLEWSAWSGAWSFTTGSEGVMLPGPQLASPPDNSILQQLRPTLSWQTLPGALGYQVRWREVGGGGSWSSLRGAGDTSYRLPPTSRLGGVYEWWVQAQSDYAYGQESSHWTFRIGNPVFLPLVLWGQ